MTNSHNKLVITIPDDADMEPANYGIDQLQIFGQLFELILVFLTHFIPKSNSNHADRYSGVNDSPGDKDYRRGPLKGAQRANFRNFTARLAQFDSVPKSF